MPEQKRGLFLYALSLAVIITITVDISKALWESSKTDLMIELLILSMFAAVFVGSSIQEKFRLCESKRWPQFFIVSLVAAAPFVVAALYFQ
ncbi:MAG: hypothetical protein G01um101470_1023 [Parcubacteria group bacterium Gr01-1014_70]|nr:MAG: hypothetical protein G01um101470_1023 [Parcubacteria group bacterium Gr01-1014_70]